MSITVDYYLSLNSPWTYMGSALFAEIAKRNGATVNVKPAKFGPIFEQTGGLPLPKRSPQRRAYRLVGVKRWGGGRGISITPRAKKSPPGDPAPPPAQTGERRGGERGRTRGGAEHLKKK